MKKYYTYDQLREIVSGLSEKIHPLKKQGLFPGFDSLYGVPKNGLYIAQLISDETGIPVILDPEAISSNTLIVDDLIDSGKTLSAFPNNKKAVLFVKNQKQDQVDYYFEHSEDWIVFPWEKEDDIHDAVIRQMEYIGEDVSREGLIETPKRVVKSWDKLYGGYKQDPVALMKTFSEGSCDEMVLLRNCEFYSTCEHHLLPFWGRIHVGYIPNGKVIGVSKLARLVEVYARRLQIQERLVTQIADILMSELNAKGAMVVADAQHFCMTARGVEKQHSSMVTSAIRGVFVNDFNARNEFLNLIK